MFKIGLCMLSDEYEKHIRKLLSEMLSEYEGIEYENIPVSSLLEKQKEKFSDIQVMAVLVLHIWRGKLKAEGQWRSRSTFQYILR